jgi:choline dehydrogenase-like flavoprotein
MDLVAILSFGPTTSMSRWLIRIILAAVVAYFISVLVTPPTCKECVGKEQLLNAYDYVVIGGGTAGSIIAAELSTRNPQKSVLLIEAGGYLNNNGASLQSIPALAPLNVQLEQIDWKFQLEPQVAALEGSVPIGMAERRINIPRGKVLGGSNELNYMMHVPATEGDFDYWAAQAEDESWKADHMKKFQSVYEYRAAETDTSGIAVGFRSELHPVAETWVRAAGQSVHGNSTNCNEGKRTAGCHYEHSIRKGVRESTARAFLLPALKKNKNLHVILNAHVTKINLESGADSQVVARSVTFVMGDSKRTADAISVSAKREVILSAGAYMSPQILQLSGIGPGDLLESVGIKTIVDLPGVGAHLQDHHLVPLKVRFGTGQLWWPRTHSKLTLVADPNTFYSYISRGAGALSSSNVDFGGFLYSNQTFFDEDRADLQIFGMLSAGDADLFNKAFKLSEQFGSSSVGAPHDWSVFGDGIAMGAALLHPNSEGSVRVTSSDPFAPPRITFEAFSDGDDIKRLTKCIQVITDILKQLAFAEYAPSMLWQNQLSKEFGAGTDKYWSEYMRRFGIFVFHPTGTCKMGSPNDPMSVVDSKLKVHGVANLRVADASIMPEISSGNTNNPTALIGLKLVDILMKEE